LNEFTYLHYAIWHIFLIGIRAILFTLPTALSDFFRSFICEDEIFFDVCNFA